jgi:hypothetical protein
VAAFGEGQITVKEAAQKFSSYPGELEGDDVDYEAVAQMFERADRAGRSHAYVDAVEDIEAARRFFEEEDEEISKKVAGAAQYVAKQANCEAEVGGAAATALRKAVKERLEKRLRERNDAHRLLEVHRKKLGDKNSAALDEQLDEVTLASYTVHIDMVEQKVRLRRMVEEAEQVKKTADASIEAEKAYQAEEGRSDEEKKASSERIDQMQKAKAGVDKAVSGATRMSEEMEKRIDESQKQYADALKKLLEALRAKVKKG